jgi:hypothetical protein
MTIYLKEYIYINLDIQFILQLTSLLPPKKIKSFIFINYQYFIIILMLFLKVGTVAAIV